MATQLPRYRIAYFKSGTTIELTRHVIQLIQEGDLSATPVWLSISTSSDPQGMVIGNILEILPLIKQDSESKKITFNLLESGLDNDLINIFKDSRELLLGSKYVYRDYTIWSKEYFVKDKNGNPYSKNINEYYVEGKLAHIAFKGSWWLKSKKIIKKWKKEKEKLESV